MSCSLLVSPAISLTIHLSRALPHSVSLCSSSLSPCRASLVQPLSLSLSLSLLFARSPRTTLPFFVRAETIPLGQFSMHGLARFFAASTPIFRRTIRRSAAGIFAGGDTRHVRPIPIPRRVNKRAPVGRLEATIPTADPNERSCFPRREDRKASSPEAEARRHVTARNLFLSPRTI